MTASGLRKHGWHLKLRTLMRSLHENGHLDVRLFDAGVRKIEPRHVPRIIFVVVDA